MMKPQIATYQDIKNGKTTDIYFERGVRILKKERIRKKVVAEIVAKSLPFPENWALFAGLEDALNILEGLPVNVRALPEGSVFYPNEPVLSIEGYYDQFAVLETALLGFLCQASGVATMAGRCRLAAQNKIILNFGTRRMHPSISPMLDRSAFIGGCDSVSTIKGAELLGMEPVGTMPHALILMKGDTVEAAKSFDKVLPSSVPRIVLIDTFNDEKFEAVRVAEALGKKVQGVRLDTPGSRRGNFLNILKEVRWELDLRGFKHVKIFVSGGLDEFSVGELAEVADGFGVGTSISNAPVIDFALDIVELDSKPYAKRGKFSGKKKILRSKSTGKRRVVPFKEKSSPKEENLVQDILKNGKRAGKIPHPKESRKRALKELKSVALLPDFYMD